MVRSVDFSTSGPSVGPKAARLFYPDLEPPMGPPDVPKSPLRTIDERATSSELEPIKFFLGQAALFFDSNNHTGLRDQIHCLAIRFFAGLFISKLHSDRFLNWERHPNMRDHVQDDWVYRRHGPSIFPEKEPSSSPTKAES